MKIQCCGVDGEVKPSTLEISELDITHKHRMPNYPYPYLRHICCFESQAHRGNRLFNSIVLTKCLPNVAKATTKILPAGIGESRHSATLL